MLTYRRNIVVGAAPLGQQSIADFPCEYGWTLALVVRYLGDYIARGHTWLASANGPRSNGARFVVTPQYFGNTTVGYLQQRALLTECPHPGDNIPAVYAKYHKV